MTAPVPITCSGCTRKRPLALLLLLLLSLAARAQKADPSPPIAAELQRAEAALRAKDQAAAERHFHNVLKLDPGNAEAQANLGAFAFYRGDCNAAEPEFRAALQEVPSLNKVQALLSICEHRMHDPAATAEMLAAFAKLDDPKLRLQLGMELANTYYQQGDLENTTAMLHRLLNMDPENVDILFFAQRVYSELADNTLNKLAVLSPNSARMEQLIAERLINAGDLKDALRHYRKALELSPKLPGVHFELAEALLEDTPNDAGAQKEALSELAAALQSDGDTAKIENELGRIAVAQAAPERAMQHFQRASELEPNNAQAQTGLADLYREGKQPEEAAKHLHAAETLDPLNASTHYKLSQIDRQLHRDEESKKELQLFTELRDAQDKVKVLYQEMTPQTAGASAAR